VRGRRAGLQRLVQRFRVPNRIKQTSHAYTPSVNHGVPIDEVDSGHDAVLELLFGNNTDLAEKKPSTIF
jgi:hypothetical protein